MKPQVLASLAVAFALISSPSLRADTVTYGPLTFGSNIPLGNGGPCTPVLKGECVEQLNTTGIFENGIGVAPFSVSQITTFTFAIAPGWSIDYIGPGVELDIYYEGEDGEGTYTPFADWGVEFFQELIVCSDADICSTGAQTLEYGGASLPLPPSNIVVGPGTGVYETFIALDNSQLVSDDPPQVNIFLSQTPEPSSWVLLSTGLLGGLVLFIQKRRSALR